MVQKITPLFPPRLTLATCFALIGVGHVASLWLDLNRIVALSLIGALLIVQASRSARPGYSFGIGRGLLYASPVYLYALVSTTWSPDPATALRDAMYTCMGVAPAIALGVALARRYSGLQIARGLGFLLLPFALQAIASAFERGDPMLVGNWSMRTLLASMLVLVSPVFAGAWVMTRRRYFLFFGFVAVVFAVTMNSRSAVLFAVPAALVSMYLQDRKFTHLLARRAIVPLIIAAPFLIPRLIAPFSADSTNLDVSDTVISELQQPSDDSVDIDRRLTTFTAIATFLEHPWVGGGYASVLQINDMEFGRAISAHGLIPGTLSEIGLLGIGILACIIWNLVRNARKTMRAPDYSDPMIVHFIVGLYALLLLGLFHQTLESVFFGLTIGLLFGIRRSIRPKRISQSTHVVRPL